MTKSQRSTLYKNAKHIFIFKNIDDSFCVQCMFYVPCITAWANITLKAMDTRKEPCRQRKTRRRAVQVGPWKGRFCQKWTLVRSPSRDHLSSGRSKQPSCARIVITFNQGQTNSPSKQWPGENIDSNIHLDGATVLWIAPGRPSVVTWLFGWVFKPVDKLDPLSSWERNKKTTYNKVVFILMLNILFSVDNGTNVLVMWLWEKATWERDHQVALFWTNLGLS